VETELHFKKVGPRLFLDTILGLYILSKEEKIMARQEKHQRDISETSQRKGQASSERIREEQPSGEITRRTATPSIWTGDPFASMRRFSDEVDRFLDDFGFPRFELPRLRGFEKSLWHPQIEIAQKGEEMVVRADLPGIKKDDIKIEVTDNALNIEGERKQEEEQSQEGFYRSERRYGHFYRSIPIPEGANTENVKASFKDGVLEIRLPVQRRESYKRKIIDIGS
jgi:HSP20 family protein